MEGWLGWRFTHLGTTYERWSFLLLRQGVKLTRVPVEAQVRERRQSCHHRGHAAVSDLPGKAPEPAAWSKPTPQRGTSRTVCDHRCTWRVCPNTPDAPETRDSPPRRGVVPTNRGAPRLSRGPDRLGVHAARQHLGRARRRTRGVRPRRARVVRLNRAPPAEHRSRRRLSTPALPPVIGSGASRWWAPAPRSAAWSRKACVPTLIAVEDAAADDLGAEYMELYRAGVERRALRRPATPARAVQLRELLVRIPRLAPPRRLRQERT